MKIPMGSTFGKSINEIIFSFAKIVKVSLICISLYYELLISKALINGTC